MDTSNKQQKISIIGLGQMGLKIAQLYIEAGFEITVWNRTAEKAKKLKNVNISATVGNAIRESDISIICVYDNNAVNEILEQIPDMGILNNKIMVNLTTGSPAEAERFEDTFKKYGGAYLNGAIQVAPDQMGLPDTTILLGGDKTVFEKVTKQLKILGGNLRHLGNTAAASPAMDLATLSWLYGSYVGLIYGAKLCQSFGLKLSDYGEIINEIVPGFKDFFIHEINTIDQGNFDITQSPLAISVTATQRIAQTFGKIGVDTEFPDIIASILMRAEAKGFAREELAAIIKVIDKDGK